MRASIIHCSLSYFYCAFKLNADLPDGGTFMLCITDLSWLYLHFVNHML